MSQLINVDRSAVVVPNRLKTEDDGCRCTET